jgi:hypothetical protein
MCPCPTLQVRGCPPPSHGRGQDGSLFLLLYDSFIHYFTPVYPDAIRVGNLPHKVPQNQHQRGGFLESVNAARKGPEGDPCATAARGKLKHTLPSVPHYKVETL